MAAICSSGGAGEPCFRCAEREMDDGRWQRAREIAECSLTLLRLHLFPFFLFLFYF